MIKIAAGFSELLPVKNISGIIAAVKNLPVELWIVGSGGEISELKKNSGKNVKFFGQLPNNQAREILRKSDIFVINSFHEGMSHALLEALAESVPIIATKIPAVTEILSDGQTGLFVTINDPVDLKQKIKKLLANPGLRNKLATNGKKLYQKKFTWKIHLKKLLADFEDHVNAVVIN